MDKDPSWINFPWNVPGFERGFPLERHSQPARMQNLRQLPQLYVRVTFADVLHNLRMKYDSLLLKGSTVTASMVAEAFSGSGAYGSSSMKQTAQTAMRLSRNVIDVTREVANKDNPEYCFQEERINKFNAVSAEKMMRLTDCRPFSSFYILPL